MEVARLARIHCPAKVPGAFADAPPRLAAGLPAPLGRVFRHCRAAIVAATAGWLRGRGDSTHC